jgi:hypothetical protein
VVNKEFDGWQKGFFILLSVIVAVYLGISGWTLVAVIDLQGRVTSIEANRFTVDDGAKVWKALAERQMIADTPPEWFKSYLDQKFSVVESRLRELESKVEKMERK